MSTKIIAITSNYLLEPVKNLISQIQADCQIQVVPYKNFATISQVYDAYAKEADGFLISGTIAKAAIESKSHEIHRPIVSFEIDMAGLYRSILELVLFNGKTNMDRVVLDFLIPIDQGTTVNTFLREYDFDAVPPHINNWISTLTPEHFDYLEKQILEKITRLWKAGQIDLVLCQYTTLIPEMEKRGIPYIYPLISKGWLETLIHKLLCSIELEQMHANLPTVINIAPRDARHNTPYAIHQLHEYMTEFFRQNLMDCNAIELPHNCNILITVEQLQYLTHHGKSCRICNFLREKAGYEVAVGYGIGLNYESAARTSYDARKESTLAGHSFIQNEKGDLIGPLNSDNRTFIEGQLIQNVGKIAKSCNLSPATVKKVLAGMKINNSDKVTTHELATLIGGTVRNANRILLNLEKGGCAKQVCTQTANSKGRPVKVYELNFGTPE